MAFCEKCGKELDYGAKFCKKCGTPTGDAANTPTVQAAASAPVVTTAGSAPNTAPPSATAAAIKGLSDKWMWVLAFSPIVFFSALVIDEAVGSDGTVGAIGVVLWFVLGIIFVQLDDRELRKIQIHLGVWSWLGCFLPFVYPFVRAAKTNKKYATATTYIVVAIVSLFIAGSLLPDDEESEFESTDTELISTDPAQSDAPSSVEKADNKPVDAASFELAAAKSKMVEAPRVIASFESAYLAALAEVEYYIDENDLVFQHPSSTLFKYQFITSSSNDEEIIGLRATALSDVGNFAKGNFLQTIYRASDYSFRHCAGNHDALDVANGLVPNFFRSGDGVCR